MTGLRFPDQSFLELQTALLAYAPNEACGLAFAFHDPNSGRFVVHEAAPVPASAYDNRTSIAACLRPQFVVDIANRCRVTGESAVFVHTHPFDTARPTFSGIDDAGEQELLRYMVRRGGPGPHLAMVISLGGCRARGLGGVEEIKVWQVGRDLSLLSAVHDDAAVDDRHDRQVRAFGAEGQRMLAGLHVGVVGAGGTGSVVIQQLAHLGVGALTLVDPDVLETTNLNRVIGGTSGGVGRTKVDVAADVIRAVNPACRVETVSGDVVDQTVAERLVPLDLVFSCTDSHASRLVVCHLAYQHLVPAIDMGVVIEASDGVVAHVVGRVQMLAPGMECLVCAGTLDFEAIRRETMTPEQRTADPYVQGAQVPQPAVVSLNSTMASLAVTMFLGATTPIPASARFQRYDAMRGTIRLASARRDPDCPVCSQKGALARGRSWAMPVRPRPAEEQRA